MKAVISWARYAELFAYNEQTGKLYIEGEPAKDHTHDDS
jgi:hypothetical protein